MMSMLLSNVTPYRESINAWNCQMSHIVGDLKNGTVKCRILRVIFKGMVMLNVAS